MRIELARSGNGAKSVIHLLLLEQKRRRPDVSHFCVASHLNHDSADCYGKEAEKPLNSSELSGDLVVQYR